MCEKTIIKQFGVDLGKTLFFSVSDFFFLILQNYSVYSGQISSAMFHFTDF